MNVYIQLFLTYLTQYRYLIPSFLLVIAGNNICRKHRCIIRGLQLQNAELKEKIKSAFYELDDPEITKPLKADGFLPVTDADYDIVRKTRKLLGMD